MSKPSIPATGGRFERDAKTGRLKQTEAPTSEDLPEGPSGALPDPEPKQTDPEPKKGS